MNVSVTGRGSAGSRAGELFQSCRLHEAITAQVEEVRAKPADANARLFLFELLVFAGDLDRARRQLDAVQFDEMARDAAAGVYRKLLDAEQARRRVLREGAAPQFLAPAPEHVRLRREAVGCLRQKQYKPAADLLNQANAAAPELRGTLNGQAFTLLRDADDLFAAVLEVLSATGAYFWVPLEQVEALSLAGPRYPRDVHWLPAHLQLRDGPAGDVFFAALYPGTHEHPDEQVKVGRMTDWTALPDGGPVLGAGVRTFLRDDDSVHLLDWRELRLGDG
jgi:type VI secretion system protein ImpE